MISDPGSQYGKTLPHPPIRATHLFALFRSTLEWLKYERKYSIKNLVVHHLLGTPCLCFIAREFWWNGEVCNQNDCHLARTVSHLRADISNYQIDWPCLFIPGEVRQMSLVRHANDQNQCSSLRQSFPNHNQNVVRLASEEAKILTCVSRHQSAVCILEYSLSPVSSCSRTSAFTMSSRYAGCKRRYSTHWTISR